MSLTSLISLIVVTNILVFICLHCCLGYLYGGNPNAPSFSTFVDSFEWYNFRKSPQLDYYTRTPVAANLSALDDPVVWLNEQSDRISSYATFLNWTDISFFQYIQSCIDTVALQIDSEITEEVQSTYNFCMSHFGFSHDQLWSLVECKVTNNRLIDHYLNSTLNVTFEQLNAECAEYSSNVANDRLGGDIISPSNLKPPGTDNFLSVKYPELVLQDPSFEYYYETVTRRFGDENKSFSSRAFNIPYNEGIRQFFESFAARIP